MRLLLRARSFGLSRALASLCALALLSCASGPPPVVRTDPAFRAGAHRVGVVGLFRNGRLEQSTWEVIASRVARPLGGVDCASAFSRAMREAEPETYASFDRRIKDEGLSDEALAILVPYTDAELLLIVDARDPQKRAPRERKAPTDLPGRPVRSGYARSATNRSDPDKAPLSTGTGYSLTASLYSVALHKLVARIDTHDAVTLQGAADELAENMAPLVRGSSCSRWKWLDRWSTPVAPSGSAVRADGAVPSAPAAQDNASRDEAGEAGAPAQ